MKKQKINIIGAGVALMLMLVATLGSVATAAEGNFPEFDNVGFDNVTATDDEIDVILADEDGNSSEVLHGSWGPQNRETYKMASPANVATFNSITDAYNSDGAGLGDERQFVRIFEIDGSGHYTAVQSLNLKANKKYQVIIYYHNDAKALGDMEDERTDVLAAKRIAKETKVATWFPREMKKGETDYVVGKISWQPACLSTMSDPDCNINGMVWASAKITADENIKLQPITGHSYLVNKQNYGEPNTTGTDEEANNGIVHSGAYLLSSNLFTVAGTKIQSYHITDWTIDGEVEPGNDRLEEGSDIYKGPDGIIYPCDRYAGRVTYQFQTVGDMPAELPEAGAIQIVMIGALVIVVAGGVGFMARTRKAMNNARGRK